MCSSDLLLLTPLLSLVYGGVNWSNAKFALVVEIVGTFVFVPLGLLVVIYSIGPEFLGFGGEPAAQ